MWGIGTVGLDRMARCGWSVSFKFFTFMSRRKLGKAERRLLRRAGLGREFKDMGGLVCALDAAAHAPRVPGYAVEPDAGCGVRCRRRLRRLRWVAFWAAVWGALRWLGCAVLGLLPWVAAGVVVWRLCREAGVWWFDGWWGV